MDVENLITCIFKKKPLWDQKDPQHHNRYILDKLWDAVGDEMNSTRQIVRTKWKSLRDSFRKELRKKPIQYSGDGASYRKSTWPYFEALSFLTDQFIARPSSGNLTEKGRSSIINDDSFSQILLEDEDPDDPIISDVAEENESQLSSSSVTPSQSKKRKQGDDIDLGAALIQLVENKIKILQEYQKKEPDEDESFFNSLLPHIRKLSPQKKMFIRMKMQEMVYNAAYGLSMENEVLPKVNEFES